MSAQFHPTVSNYYDRREPRQSQYIALVYRDKG